MSDTTLRKTLATSLEELRTQGLFKRERQLQGPQGAEIRVADRTVINFCANNYLGLANHPAIVEAAHEGLRRYGYGMASVRFICGTQDLHTKLERMVADFLGKEDAILYTSCFDANTGLFETLLGDEDAIISDELNHASIIDGVRLCKAKRYRYKHSDMADLERCLKESSNCRLRMIATDGVFSMDGDMARLPDICAWQTNTMPSSWWMIVMQRAFSEPEAAARPSTLVYSIALISSQALWARHLAEQRVVSLAAERKSLPIYVSAHDPTCFQTHYLPSSQWRR